MLELHSETVQRCVMDTKNVSDKHTKERRAGENRRDGIERRRFGTAAMGVLVKFQRRLNGVRRAFQRRKTTEEPEKSE